jgi:transposase
MKTQGKKIDFSDITVFVGLDTHANSWQLATCTLRRNPTKWPVTIKPPFVENFVKQMHKQYPNAEFVCGYEAGFCGFWIKEELEKRGFKTLVLNAADIPTNDKERKQKEDKRDARKIAKALKNGDVDSIYVPDKQSQIDRSLVRERYSIVKCVSRAKNQIKSHLQFYNITPPEDINGKNWSNRFIDWIEDVARKEGDTALSLKVKRLNSLKEILLEANRELRALAKKERYKERHDILISVPGIGTITAMLLLTEIIDMKRFSNFEKLKSYIGLIPTMNSSGSREVTGSLTQRCNELLRTALIESSWTAIGSDMELRSKYEQMAKAKNSQYAIVKIAVILLRRIRSIWLSEKKYIVAEC